MVEDCICAIDQGTQSTRVLLFDKTATIVSKHQVDFTQHTPRTGWVEHDALEILQSVHTCIEGALNSARHAGKRVSILAVGITNQRETTLVWDPQTGKPLHKAIVWFDSRTSAICHAFQEKLGSGDHFRPKTGLPISTYFSAYKFRWLVENVPEVGKAVEEGKCFLGTIDAWLIWNLSGGPEGGLFVTDVTNASRTNLMDLELQQWDSDLLNLFGVQQGMLPEIKSNAEVYARIASGPLAGIPIAGCLGDQQAALLGQSCRKGEAKNTYGTGCFLLLNTGNTSVQSSHGLITTVGYQLGRNAEVQYALEGSIAVAGVGVRWLRDNLGIIKTPEESEELARSVPDTAGVYFVPAFNGLLAPHWRDDARGSLLGLTSYSTAAHIVRAMLEAIAWQTKDVLNAMRDDSDCGGMELLKVDGGASNNDLLMQLQADIMQLPVRRPEMLETTALGAAYAAGIGIGFWDANWVLHEAAVRHQEHSEFRPEAAADSIQTRYKRWQKAVQRSYDLAEFTDT